MTEKQCTKCLQFLPLNKFSRKGILIEQKHARCKCCRLKEQDPVTKHKWYLAHKLDQLAKSKLWQETHKLAVSARNKRWKRRNLPAVRAMTNAYRWKLRKQSPIGVDTKAILDIYKQ